jgi:deoxyxylulose-5-phosphate synthase
MLTGRRERFRTIRTPGGLNGFMLRTESPHDSYGAGHAGTALSAALGMAVARDKTGGKEHVVAVAGDAAFTCGITYEALNNIAHHTRRMIVVLNDNEWSIDKNVGRHRQLSAPHCHQPALRLSARPRRQVRRNAGRPSASAEWRAKPKRPPRACCGPA